MGIGLWRCRNCGLETNELPLREVREDLCDECFKTWANELIADMQKPKWLISKEEKKND